MNGPSRPATDKRKQIGQAAETMASQHLQGKGYEILNQNWQIRTGEIDIIAKDDETLVFVEVRSRHESKRFGSAEESVDLRKQLKIRRTAEVYLMQQHLTEKNVRFDVIAITRKGNKMELTHIKNAF